MGRLDRNIHLGEYENHRYTQYIELNIDNKSIYSSYLRLSFWFNGNKIITGSCGGMFLTNSKDDADKVRKWSTQSRENAPWYEHEEVGYNYRMSNMIAGFIRGQIPYLQTHIDQKKAIYERYNREWWEEIISGEYQNYYAKMYGKLDFCSLGFGLLCCSSI